MKSFVVLMLGIAGNIFAFQPSFQIDYTNHAWGYDNHGCFIDREGNVYKYRYGHSSDGKGIVPAGKMSEADLKFANELTDKARNGVYTTQHAAFDAGVTSWTAFTAYGEKVDLLAHGDEEGKNDSPEAAELVKLLNGLCVFQYQDPFQGLRFQ